MWRQLLPSFEQGGIIAYVCIWLAATLESTAFVGLFFPGTTLVVFVGYLASRGTLALETAVWVVALGGIAGDAISFYLGRGGEHLIKPGNRFFKPEHLAKAKLFFARHGSKSVLLARFVGPLRPIVPFVAGLAEMDAKRFFLYNVIGGVASAFTYILIGYYFGGAWRAYHHLFRRFEPLLLIGLAALLVRWWWLRHLRSQKKSGL